MFESGQVIGDRYRLEGRLGDNEARQTWLAEDTAAGELVTLKLLAVSGATQWDDVRLMEREAETLRSLNHPQLPKFRDYVELSDQDGWFALVMDYIPGISLKQKLNDRYRFDIEEIEAIAKSVLEILDYLHHHRPPILHRDIKPSNLIAGDDDEIYLIDFGAVQNQPRQEGMTFTVAGTFGYTPIEQFGGQTCPASDVYAFGATLVHLLTGIAPMDLPQHNFRLQFRDRLPEELPQEWVEWLEMLTAPDVGDRYQSVTAALNELLLLQRDRRLGNHTPRSLPSVPGDLSGITDRSESPPKSHGVLITEQGDRLMVELPSRFATQVLGVGQAWVQDLLAELKFQLRSAPLAKSIKLFKTLNLWKLTLILALLLLAVGPRTALNLILWLMALPFSAIAAAAPLLLVVVILVAACQNNYFDSASLSLMGDRFLLNVNGLNGRHLTGQLHQIQSCEVVPIRRFKFGDRPTYALALTLQPVGVWRFKVRPEVHFLGESLPLEELEAAAQRIKRWMRHHA